MDDVVSGPQAEDLAGDFLIERRPGMTRNRIVVAFDAAYSAQGLAAYSAIRLLVDQLGSTIVYDAFFFGAYRGPRFTGAARVNVTKPPHGLDESISGVAERLRRLLVSSHLAESPQRWESNLDREELKLLRRLFDADELQAVIIFAADPEFALRVARLVHIYSTTETPHIIVVTPNTRLASRILADLDWLGAHVLRDGDPVVDRLRGTLPDAGPDRGGKAITSVFSFLSTDEYPRQLTNPCDQIDWSVWAGSELAFPKRVRDVVLFFRPDWVNCGSSTTFGNLAQWFRERDALLIDVGIWPYREDFDPLERDARVASEQESIRSALYFATRLSTSAPHFVRQIRTLFQRFPRTLARQKSFQHGLAAKPRFIRRAIQRAKISHIYINHYFTYDYAHEFVGDRPFFLDTHDIQTVNFIHYNIPNVITGRVDRFEASLRHEMEIAGKAQRLCFVSADEMSLAARYIDRDRLDYVLPLPKVVPCQAKPPAAAARLLIVASDNPGNVQSMGWFFTQVWPIVLSLCGNRPSPLLRVCGGIGAVMGELKLPSVEFVGVVPTLWSYYDETDLVLLPIIAGGGVAIKTLEAALHERPMLATRHALRGLPDTVVQTIGYEDDPEVFAESLLAIISDPERHAAQVERSRRAASLLRQHSFYDVLGKAVDSVRLTPPRRAEELTTKKAAGVLSIPEGGIG